MSNAESFFETDEEWEEWDQSMREIRKCQQCEELAGAVKSLMDFGNNESQSKHASWAMNKAREALAKYRGEA